MLKLKAPDLYNTGYINSNVNDELRMKQGLMTQNLSSSCYSPPVWYSYNVPVDNAYQCMGNNLYPIKLPRPNYGSKAPSDNCYCARFVQAP